MGFAQLPSSLGQGYLRTFNVLWPLMQSLVGCWLVEYVQARTSTYKLRLLAVIFTKPLWLGRISKSLHGEYSTCPAYLLLCTPVLCAYAHANEVSLV